VSAIAVKVIRVRLPLLAFLMLVLYPPVQMMLVEHSFRQAAQRQEALDKLLLAIQ
jgi:hypothetical protein